MHPHSPHQQLAELFMNESDDLVILGVTFYSKMTFERHLRSVSRAAFQRLGILRKSWRVSMTDRFLGYAFGVLPCPFWSTLLQIGARLPKHTWLAAEPRSTTGLLFPSLWNDLADPVFDGVVVAGFKSRANDFLLG